MAQDYHHGVRVVEVNEGILATTGRRSGGSLHGNASESQRL